MICPVCSQHVTKQKFEKHLYLKHNIRIKDEMYECDACSRTFLSQRSLRLHQLQTHNPANRSGSPGSSSAEKNQPSAKISKIENNKEEENNINGGNNGINAATQMILDKIKQENEQNNNNGENSSSNGNNLSSEQRLQLEIQKYVNKQNNGESSPSTSNNNNNSSVLPTLLNM